MLQQEVPDQLGVVKTSDFNWEREFVQPANSVYARDHPVPRVRSAAECEHVGRPVGPSPDKLGTSQKESAQRLGVDPGTLARWERGEREPKGEFAKRERPNRAVSECVVTFCETPTATPAVLELGGVGEPRRTAGVGSAAWPQPTAMSVHECRAKVPES